MLPQQTRDSFQDDVGDETTVIYSKLKITPEVKENVATQVDEKVKEEVATQVDEKRKEEVATQVDEKVKEEVATQVDEKGKEEVATQVDEKGKEEVATKVDEKGKEATQTAEGMQRDEEELADQSNKNEMDEDESECMHGRVHFNCLSITLLEIYTNLIVTMHK